MNGEELLLCDHCYQSILVSPVSPFHSQRKKAEVSEAVSAEKDSLSSITTHTASPQTLPVVVTFMSSPLGVSLQSGRDARNAMLVRVERFENNDYGMKVPLNSFVLQINDVVTIDMPYQEILTLIKKFPLPIVILFGPLSDSREQNIRTVLCAHPSLPSPPSRQGTAGLLLQLRALLAADSGSLVAPLRDLRAMVLQIPLPKAALSRTRVALLRLSVLLSALFSSL